MGILDAALGNAQDADATEVDALIGPILVTGETISHAFVVGARDLLLFSNKRMILIDKTGFTGKKMHISSYPWRTILMWSMTNSGKIDLDSELRLQLQGMPMPISFSFPKKTDLKPIVKVISEHILL